MFLDYFGRFHGHEIKLQPGINLIYGDNEAGKSTIHTFIKGMLFGIERARGRAAASKEDIYTRYLPWDYPGAFRGTMDIEVGDRKYRIHRSFHANDKSFVVTDLETGREVKLKSGHISDILPGLTESAYKNTISMEQLKASTDAELASALRNYMANLSMSKSNEVNVSKALQSLTLQKKTMESSLNQAERSAIEAAIQEGEEREQQLEVLASQLQKIQIDEETLKKEKQVLIDQIDGKEIERMEQLPAIMEKYRNFRTLTWQSLQIKEKRMEWKKQEDQLEEKRKSIETLEEDCKASRDIIARLEEQNLIRQKLQQELADIDSKIKGNFRVSLLLFSVLAMLAIVIIGFKPMGILISAMFLSAGILCGRILNRSTKRNWNNMVSTEAEAVKKYSTLQEVLSAIYIRNQVSSSQELMQKQEEQIELSYALKNVRQQLSALLQQESEAEDSRDNIYEEIMKYIQHFLQEDELTDEAIQRLQEEINGRRQRQQQRQQEVDRKLEGIKMDIEKLKWEISKLEENEEELLKNKARYLEIEQQERENALELDAIKFALNTIQELSSTIHDSFGNQLNRTVSDTIGSVTDDKYSDIKMDEKLDIKVGWNEEYIPFERLSIGTIDQVYLSLRLAVSDLLLGKNAMPFILDDSFAYYDDKRVRSALQQLSARPQVILFSCHKREQKLLEELKLSYHYVELQ